MPGKKAFDQLCSELKLDETRDGMTEVMPSLLKAMLLSYSSRPFRPGDVR